MPATLDELNNRAAAAKAAYNLMVSQFTPFLTEITAKNTTSFFAKQLTAYLHEFNTAYAEYKQVAFRLQADFKANDHWIQVTNAAKTINETNSVIYAHLKETDNPINQDKIPAIEPTKNAALFKPRTLLHEATMSEFLQWQHKFRAYYTQSKVDLQPAHIHKAFLMTCIDDHLSEFVELQINKDTFIYPHGDGFCYMATLEQFFRNLHPKHIRLHKLTALDPTPNQLASGFFQEFLRLSNDAKATELTAEELLVSLMTTKCPNKELRTELLRNPRNLPSTVQLALEYDAAQRGQNTNGIAAIRQTKCTRCNSDNHKPEACWTHKNPCPKCKKTGHIKANCRVKIKPSNANAVSSGNSSNAINSATDSIPTPSLLL